jgi:UDP-N-acetylmuramate: L-alanyl-gamma-D-glutamyl-meso-diaminopimelate ligase
VEHVLNRGLPYTSGAQWLSDNFLQGKWVLAVAGTHGKTTTAAMLAWILEYAGMKPGFLIGGIPQNFGLSARPGETPFFVVEADEYDTAFFDKRSKFVHYRPRTLVLNNLEFDHADIFPDLAAIKRQFHHLVRTVPGQGLLLAPEGDSNLAAVLAQGCWTPVESFGGSQGWSARNGSRDGSQFDVYFAKEKQGTVEWELLGQHNVNNALAAIGAARHSGVPAAQAIHALCEFENVKRRMELRGEVNGIRVYDDFAHHPTAIATTLAGLRHKVGSARIIAVLEPRSNTMRMGVHKETLLPSLEGADKVFIFTPPDLGWSLPAEAPPSVTTCSDFDLLLQSVLAEVQPGDHLLVMSNGGFNGIHAKLLEQL